MTVEAIAGPLDRGRPASGETGSGSRLFGRPVRGARGRRRCHDTSVFALPGDERHRADARLNDTWARVCGPAATALDRREARGDRRSLPRHLASRRGGDRLGRLRLVEQLYAPRVSTSAAEEAFRPGSTRYHVIDDRIRR